jgi:hypothetical protein
MPRVSIPRAVLKYIITMTPITTPVFTIMLMVAGKAHGVTGVTSAEDRAVNLQVKRPMPSEPVKTATVKNPSTISRLTQMGIAV